MKAEKIPDYNEQKKMNIYITVLAVPFVLIASFILASIFSIQEFFYPNNWGIPVEWLVGGIIGVPAVLIVIWFFVIRK